MKGIPVAAPSLSLLTSFLHPGTRAPKGTMAVDKRERAEATSQPAIDPAMPERRKKRLQREARIGSR